MNIYKIHSNKSIVPSTFVDSTHRADENKRDEITLSSEAQAQFVKNQKKNFDIIQQRIDSGWYFTRNAREQIAVVLLSSGVI
jgi:predicted transcriptional regulator YheO